MIISALEANEMHFKVSMLCLETKLNGPFSLHCITLYCFYDVNLTILPLDRPITAEFTKGFSMKMSLINILCLQTIQIIIMMLQITQQTIDLCPPMIN